MGMSWFATSPGGIARWRNSRASRPCRVNLPPNADSWRQPHTRRLSREALGFRKVWQKSFIRPIGAGLLLFSLSGVSVADARKTDAVVRALFARQTDMLNHPLVGPMTKAWVLHGTTQGVPDTLGGILPPSRYTKNPPEVTAPGVPPSPMPVLRSPPRRNPLRRS